MAPALRAIRRAEIDSDIWEFEHDSIANGPSPAIHMIIRLVAGIPSDLCWRVESVPPHRYALGHRAALAATAALVITVLWIAPVWFGRSQSNVAGGVRDCADEYAALSAASRTRADYRMQVFSCVGAFFGRDTRAAPPRGWDVNLPRE
jgi:hypothetical protein